MAQQVRQIGVMKAIGARTGQVADMYLALALLLGALAAALGIPIAKMAARGYAAFAAQMLNFEIIDASMPWGIYLILVVVGLATPVISALWPVWRGSGITVRESITDYGIRAKANSRRLLDRLIELVPALPRPLLLSLANTFRRRGRIVLTMTTLTLGGAMFITALNIGASITKTIGVFQNAMQYDLRVTFTKPIANDRLSAVSKSIPGITRVEPWGQSKASLVLDDGLDGNEFTVMAPPAGTDLLKPRVIEGRMTTAKDEKALIVNHIFMNEHPHLKVGDEVLLRMGNQKTKWRILGVIRQIGPPTAFTTYDYLSTLMGQQGLATTMAVVTDQRSVQAHQTAANRMEQAYRDAGIEIVDTVSIYTIQRILEDHFRILTLLLLFMAGLIVLVGGLALMTTMSIQVLERTREIGVMRAIGASNHELMRIIGTEGLVIGLASWVLALFLSVPLSKYIGDVFGLIFLRTTLDFALSPYAFMLWLGVVVIFSLAASFFPAKKATGLTVRETLAYE
jgi:putative ABC transport system permease protein